MYLTNNFLLSFDKKESVMPKTSDELAFQWIEN